MKILVFPRDASPYLKLLHSELERLDVRIAYVGALTGSHSANLLLLPFELVVRRALGWRVLHIHWVFGFSMIGAGRVPWMRAVSQLLFNVCLTLARWLGLCIAWTAHNVIPHEPVFWNDVVARRRLVAAADVVFVHSEATVDALRRIRAVPRRRVVIQHGPFESDVHTAGARPAGVGDGRLHLAFVGRVAEYKGIEDLLAAAARLPAAASVRLTVAGACEDEQLERRIRDAARDVRVPTTLRLEYVRDEELTALLNDADAIVLPFRRITTSGSVQLAMGYGRPVLIPDLPTLRDLPGDAVVRYDGGIDELAAAMQGLTRMSRTALAEIGLRARTHVEGLSWRVTAERTVEAFRTCSPGVR
jgi:glycosyltransferase involved in cell wall biosynthesis